MWSNLITKRFYIMTDNYEQRVRESIENIVDPDLNLSLKDLKAIERIDFDEKSLLVDLRLVQPFHFVAEKIIAEVSNALSPILDGREVEVNVRESLNSISKKDILAGVKNIIAVASGKGGVGKSSLAANIAASLQQKGAVVGILDGDVYGPSQPTMFGMPHAKLQAEQLPDGSTVAKPLEKYGIKIASMGFVMNREEAAIVRGPMLASYFSMLFEQIDWGGLDFMIFDLPPGTGDIQLTLTQKIPLTGAVVITTPQEIAVADVRRSLAMFGKVDVDVLGIIENMSYFTPPDMPDKKYYIFGEGGGKKVAEESNVDFLGEVPLNMEMRDGNDSGRPFVLSGKDSEQVAAINSVVAKMVTNIRKLNHKASKQSGLEIIM